MDSDLALFELPQGQQAWDLPVIIGLERKIPGPRPGKRYNIKELITALNIIKGIETNGLFKKYKIERIDITNPANISCFIRLSGYSQGQVVTNLAALEVKMGQDDSGDKIRVLAGLFTQLQDDIGKIKYIDLRFKEPVIKFKDAK